MIRLDVLAVGSLRRDGEGKILDAHSSSVLIRSGESTVVADTGTEYMRPAIKTSFRQIGIFPRDVDTVVLTHSHSDHTGNIGMFEGADILIHEDECMNVPGSRPVDLDRELAPGVRAVHTPGHTSGSVSIFIEADKRYVIAGDAVPTRSNCEKMLPPAVNIDPDLALESIKRITKYADVIIPGHGPPFPVKGDLND
ncbi:MAG: MBL fold metallo-hydrolase [Candidatus Methanoplasma sp.]|jgi:glyoxylase-like metal-dependent hydrolase (beta-lactamase superfamily II)|nr:MBL fold metallo-hydrolase [Candidatus Methanoplasma sp.]